MPGLSTLCRVCHCTLYAERCSLTKPQHVYVYESHHPTLDSLLSAVRANCYVCRVVYDNVNHQAQNQLMGARTGAASTMFRMRSKGRQGLQLVVIFLGNAPRVETKFQLLPSGGMYAARDADSA